MCAGMLTCMDIEWIRQVCLGLPDATETVQWGNDLVFKIGGKMFAVASLERAAVCLSFKCTPESFAELTERQGIIPAPYLARAKWVALQDYDAVPARELKALIEQAYELVKAKLPKKARLELEAGKGAGPAKPKR